MNKKCDLAKNVDSMMGACWARYSEHAKECSRCALMLRCASATKSYKRRRGALTEPDCTPLEYLVSLMSQNMLKETRMIEGCITHVFRGHDSNVPIAFIAIEPDVGEGEKIMVADSEGREYEFDGIGTFEMAKEIARKFSR